MTEKKIIIVGYPKSGNTWVTRLTAELINCPVKGFLYEKDNPEVSIEGLNRPGDFLCYKSHHQFKELAPEDRKGAKIIYVIRDPRDIVLSGTGFFYNLNPLKVRSFKARSVVQVINRCFRILIGNRIMRKRMINAVINGDARVHHWCRISWENHLSSYTNESNVLLVKYEALLKDPITESKKIIDFLDVKKDFIAIESAVNNQSFEKVKNKFLANQQIHKAKFLRKGSAEQWRNELSKSEKELFLVNLKPKLEILGYNLK